MTGEIWKTVPSAPQFLASSEGRIMVVPHIEAMPNGGTRQYGGEPHFGVWSKIDARFITVLKGRTYKVASLVCEAFNGPKTDLAHVCMHIDENSANNRPSNLTWGTQKQNLNFPLFRERNSARRRVISPHDAAEIVARCAAGEKQASVAADYDVSFQTISDVVRGKKSYQRGGADR